MQPYFNWSIFWKYLPILARSAPITFAVVIASIFLGAIIGLIMAAVRLSRSKILQFIGRIYVEIIRGVPFLVQVLWLFFGITLFFGINLNPITAGIFSLSLWSGAYFTEIFRGGILSIHQTQSYAAYSLGMTPKQAFYRIILPQAFKKMIPPCISQFITTTKSSAVLSVINVPELTKRADAMSAALYAPFEIYLACGVVFFVILFAFFRLGKYAEKKLQANTLQIEE